MRHVPGLMALATCLATPVLADCPVASDLKTGIELRDDDGYVSVYRQSGPFVVMQEGAAPDGYRFQNLLGQGTHVLQLADVENGSLVRDSIINVSYGMQPAEMPVPEEGLNWQVGTMVNAYGETYRENQSQRWGTAQTLRIAECEYRVIPGRLTYKSDGDTIREEVLYVTELGIGLLTSYSDGTGYEDSFAFVSIRVAP